MTTLTEQDFKNRLQEATTPQLRRKLAEDCLLTMLDRQAGAMGQLGRLYHEVMQLTSRYSSEQQAVARNHFNEISDRLINYADYAQSLERQLRGEPLSAEAAPLVSNDQLLGYLSLRNGDGVDMIDIFEGDMSVEKIIDDLDDELAVTGKKTSSEDDALVDGYLEEMENIIGDLRELSRWKYRGTDLLANQLNPHLLSKNIGKTKARVEKIIGFSRLLQAYQTEFSEFIEANRDELTVDSDGIDEVVQEIAGRDDTQERREFRQWHHEVLSRCITPGEIGFCNEGLNNYLRDAIDQLASFELLMKAISEHPDTPILLREEAGALEIKSISLMERAAGLLLAKDIKYQPGVGWGDRL